MSVAFDIRTIIIGILAGTMTLGIPSDLLALGNAKEELKLDSNILKGKINHSVARWCFNDFDIETLVWKLKKLELPVLIWLVQKIGQF